MNKAIFLDKDGTMIKNVPYNVDPSLVQFYPDVFQTLKTLKDYGYTLILISNQSGVAQGKFTKLQAVEHMQYIQNIVKTKAGVALDAWYFCPHHPAGTVIEFSGECECRKPLPGLIEQAASDHDISLSDSWMVGDILHDVEAGNRAGCKTILINNGNETEWVLSEYRTPTHIVKKFSDITKYILKYEKVVNFQVKGGVL